MTKRGARQGRIAIQPLHLRHGAGAGRRAAGRKATGSWASGRASTRHGGRRSAEWRSAQRVGARTRRCDTTAWGYDTTGKPGHDTTLVRASVHLGVLAGLCVTPQNIP